MAKVFRWVNANGIFNITMMLWGMWLVTMVTLRVFSDSPPNIPTGTAAAYATLFGLPTIVIGFWKWKADRVRGGNDGKN